MLVLFSIAFQPLLPSVLFGGFAQFSRLVLREEEGIVAEHKAVKLRLVRVRLLPLTDLATLIDNYWSIDDIRSISAGAFPTAQGIYRFHFQDNSWLVSLFELIKLLTWCFRQSSHLLNIPRFSLVEATARWV